MSNNKRKIETTGLLPMPGPTEALVSEKKKRVILRAPVLTQSGYGVHSRQLARWLFKQLDSRTDLEVFVEPLSWGITPWIVDTEAHDGLIGRMVQHSRQSDSYDVSLQLQLPNEWNPFLADFNIGISAVVEADSCPPDWIQSVNQMDLIIVPSEFAKQAFTNTGTCTTEIVVVPEAFTDECADDAPETDMPLDNVDTKFNFLVFGQFCGNNPDNDRKNLAYTIKWLSETFKDEPDVGVIVKTNFGKNSKLDRANTINILGKVILETRKGPGPSFYLLHGDMTDAEVAALYKSPKVNALVSFTRGEGFGLPILEAAACGLPVIVTNWSAHTEFLKQGKFVKIDYNLVPLHPSRVDNKIFFPEMRWANADERDAKRKLRRFRDSSKVPEQWAKELAAKLQKTHSFDAISARYTEVLKDVI